MLPVQHLTQSIARSPAEVVAFAGDPANLPRWASGLSSGIRHEGGRWLTDSPMGEVAVRFAPANDFGVLDHDIELADGTVVHNPVPGAAERPGERGRLHALPTPGGG